MSDTYITRRGVWVAIIAIAIFMGIVHAGALGVFHALSKPSSNLQSVVEADARKSAVNLPQPLLQESVNADLKALRAHEDEILNSYGWEDRVHGIIRIPINRAMDLMIANHRETS